MEFGKLQSLEGVDFSLPPDPPENEKEPYRKNFTPLWDDTHHTNPVMANITARPI